jgi:hypothetical protein
MPIGDDAVAAGMPILDGSEQADDIDLHINETRDLIAQRTNAVTPVLKGGTGATDAAGARANLDAVSSAQLATKAAAGHTHTALYGSGGGIWGWQAIYSEWNSNANGYFYGYLTVNGPFYNPSARHMKRNIEPAPVLDDIFPEFVEYEKVDGDGTRELGYIADDLVGTDAERFVQFRDGEPNAISYLSLLVAQVAQLQKRVAELEAKA